MEFGLGWIDGYGYMCIELCICNAFGVFINEEFFDSLLHAVQVIVNTC